MVCFFSLSFFLEKRYTDAQGGRYDFQSEGVLFSDDIIMASLLLDFNQKSGEARAPLPGNWYSPAQTVRPMALI